MLRFHVPAMACGGCAKSVSKALLAVDSEARIEIDLPTRHVQVDTKLSDEALLAVLEQAGFPAECQAEVAS